ncbi:hypothetical protein DFR65_10583 [Oceanihabitans sediminis]|nr:hypothetical protein DFR65_10583 [Oceanihabitans sediminis]
MQLNKYIKKQMPTIAVLAIAFVFSYVVHTNMLAKITMEYMALQEQLLNKLMQMLHKTTIHTTKTTFKRKLQNMII